MKILPCQSQWPRKGILVFPKMKSDFFKKKWCFHNASKNSSKRFSRSSIVILNNTILSKYTTTIFSRMVGERHSWTCRRWLEHFIEQRMSPGTHNFHIVSPSLYSIRLPPQSKPNNNHFSSPDFTILGLWLAYQNSLQLVANNIYSSQFACSMPCSQGRSLVSFCPSSFERRLGHHMGT